MTVVLVCFFEDLEPVVLQIYRVIQILVLVVFK